MRRFLSTLRLRSLLVLALMLAPALAFAQATADSGVAAVDGPPGWVQWAVAIVTGLLAVIAVAGPKIAALTPWKADDAAVKWIGENKDGIEAAVQKVAEWADPKNPAVPPSPTNPEGKA